MFYFSAVDLQITNIHVIAESDIEGTQIAVFDFDDSCYHFFVHDIAVAITQMRKSALEASFCGLKQSAEEEEKRFLDVYLNRRGLGEAQEQQLRQWLPRFVRYRAALIVCWASEERRTGGLTGPAAVAWFSKSLPLYQAMLDNF